MVALKRVDGSELLLPPPPPPPRQAPRARILVMTPSLARLPGCTYCGMVASTCYCYHPFEGCKRQNRRKSKRWGQKCAYLARSGNKNARRVPGVRAGADSSVVEEAAQVVTAGGVTQLAQGLGFDLTDTLPGDVELLADFFQGVIRIHVDTEAHAQYLGFPCGESGEDLAGGFLEVFHGGRVDRRFHGAVLDEVAQMRIFVVANRGLHGDRLLGDLQHFADLVLGHLHALAQLLGGGLATHLLEHLPGNPVELVDGLDHVYRNTDGPGLIGNRAGDGLGSTRWHRSRTCSRDGIRTCPRPSSGRCCPPGSGPGTAGRGWCTSWRWKSPGAGWPRPFPSWHGGHGLHRSTCDG